MTRFQAFLGVFIFGVVKPYHAAQINALTRTKIGLKETYLLNIGDRKMKKSNFTLCQTDKNKGAEYHTFALERDSKYGFVCFVPSFDYVAHVAFDTAEDYMELVDCADESEPGYYDYNELTSLEVGRQTCIGDAIWLRLW